jgi:hypothetical protein
MQVANLAAPKNPALLKVNPKFAKLKNYWNKALVSIPFVGHWNAAQTAFIRCTKPLT